METELSTKVWLKPKVWFEMRPAEGQIGGSHPRWIEG
jgi:hypothetical protein